MKYLFRFCFIYLITIYFTAFSSDGKRHGFILGAGTGAGLNCVKSVLNIDTTSAAGAVHYNTSFCFDLKIGYNLQNSFELAYINKSDITHPYSGTILNNASSFSLSYYFKNISPSFYINTSEGISFRLYPFNTEMNNRYSGLGFCGSLGLGFEFKKHLSVLLEYQFTNPEHKSTIQSIAIDDFGNSTSENRIGYTQIYYTNAVRLTFSYNLY